MKIAQRKFIYFTGVINYRFDMFDNNLYRIKVFHEYTTDSPKSSC